MNLFDLFVHSITYTPGDFVDNFPILYDGVAFATDLTQKSFNLRNSADHRLGFTKDRLFMFNPMFLFRNNSMLTTVIDRQLQLFQEVGLIQFWIQNNIENRRSIPKQNAPTRMNLGNFAAAFQICGLLYVISVIVFLIEIWCAKQPRIKLIIEYFTY